MTRTLQVKREWQMFNFIEKCLSHLTVNIFLNFQHLVCTLIYNQPQLMKGGLAGSTVLLNYYLVMRCCHQVCSFTILAHNSIFYLCYQYLPKVWLQEKEDSQSYISMTSYVFLRQSKVVRPKVVQGSLTLSPPEPLPWQVKSSGVRPSKILKSGLFWPVW